jgi:hypothetical protein
MKFGSFSVANAIMAVTALVLVFSQNGRANVNPAASEEILENEIWCGVDDPTKRDQSNIFIAPTAGLSDEFRIAMGQIISPSRIEPYGEVIAQCWSNTSTFICNLNIQNRETKLVIDLTTLQIEINEPGTQSSTGVVRSFSARAEFLGKKATCKFGNRRANSPDFSPSSR